MQYGFYVNLHNDVITLHCFFTKGMQLHNKFTQLKYVGFNINLILSLINLPNDIDNQLFDITHTQLRITE
jgi:hypothetical protein